MEARFEASPRLPTKRVVTLNVPFNVFLPRVDIFRGTQKHPDEDGRLNRRGRSFYRALSVHLVSMRRTRCLRPSPTINPFRFDFDVNSLDTRFSPDKS